MSELAKYRRAAKQAALDLGYSEKTIKAICLAKSENEISRIMGEARREMKGV